jgi:enoyl-CoA hydratase
MADKLVRLADRGDGVWTLTLDDPRRHNAISLRMRDELVEGCALLTRSDVRALVVTGAGPSFCSGADLGEVLQSQDRNVSQMRTSLRGVYEGFLAVRDLPFPTIAAVHGHAIGAGLNLALSCDLRLAGPRARFGATFVRIGLHPGGGCTYFLTNAVGRQRALSILLQGQTLSAQDAAAAGLVLSVHDDVVDEGLALARRIASVEPGLARDIKATVILAAEDGFEAATAHETWAQAFTATQPMIWQSLAPRRAADRD